MPKDSVVINGFNGGLNVDSSTSDLISDGRGKDQLAQMERVYTDQLGKVVAKHPQATSGASNGLTDSGVDTGGSDILIHDNTIYQENGLYKMGDDVVWSGNTDYQAITPTAGAYNPGTPLSNNNGEGLDVKFEPKTDGIVIFQGKNSTLGESITGHILFDEEDRSISDRYIKFSMDGDSDGVSGEGSMYHWIHEDLHPINTHDASECHTSIMSSESSGSLDTFYWEDVETPGQNDFVGDEPTLLRFKVGRGPHASAFNIDVNNPASTTGAYGGNLPSIRDRDIILELRCKDVLVLEKLIIYLDTDIDDHIIHYNYSSLNSWMKSYEISGSDLDTLGASSGFIQVVIPYSSEIWEGSNYRGDQFIRTVGVVPVWASLSNSVLTSEVERFELRYLAFSDSANSTWMNRIFQFKQSSISSEVESLLRPYVSNTGSLINADYKLTIPRPSASGDSGRLYYKEIFEDETTEIGSNFLLLEYDYDKGVKAANNEDFIEWNSSNECSVVFSVAPISSTHALESGYPDGTSEVNALWKTAATIGRQVYIGNVKQPIDATEYDASLILKSAIGKPAGFSDKTYIDIEVGGDSITVLESSGDRLFVFTNNQLSIVNVAQDIEFLEAELPNYGIESKNQVCKVGEGIAFINETGVYYFNGQNFQELKGTAISTADFSGSKAILYDEVRKLLWCYADTSIVYYYSFKTNTWVGKDSTINVFPATNGTGYIDGKVHFADSITAGQSDIYKLDGSGTTATDRAFSFQTGRIDCGDPSREKRFYSVYVFVHNSFSELTFEYSLDGGTTFSNTRAFTEIGLNQFKINDITDDTDPQGKTGRDIVIRIKGVDASTEIDDITIVFRNKVLK